MLGPMLPGLMGGGGGPVNEVIFDSAGTFSFVVPAGITSISAVAVGNGASMNFSVSAPGGGALQWANNIPVTPGETLTVGLNVSDGVINKSSFIARGGTRLLWAQGSLEPASNTQRPNAASSRGSSVGETGGGNGGRAGTGIIGGTNPWGGYNFAEAGCGGAGGYLGSGGNGGNGQYVANGGSGSSGSGGGGGGGGGGGRTGSQDHTFGGIGGGTGLFGVGPNGSGGAGGNNDNYNTGANGEPGSGGENVSYGGGIRLAGSNAAVRIIWGDARSFPYNAGPEYLPEGNTSYTSPGTYEFTVPEDVYSVSILSIGKGGNGGNGDTTTSNGNGGSGGGGGGLIYKNDLPVTPGSKIYVVISASHSRVDYSGFYIQANAGGNGVPSGSSFVPGGTVSSSSGSGAVGYTGGQGGYRTGLVVRRGGGGGGAAGYTGIGGNCPNTQSDFGAPLASTGAGASGQNGPTSRSGGGGGGGVGLLGSGSTATSASQAGSGGTNGGAAIEGNGGGGGGYGGGGGGGRGQGSENYTLGGAGGPGAVRIIWGPGRSFPYNAGLI